MALPPAALLYCFADELIEPDDWKSRGEKVPGKEVKVKQSPLAAHVLALSLFGLRQAGFLTMRVERKKSLMFTKTSVVLHAPAPLPGWSVEHALGKQVTPGQEVAVWDVVYRMLGRDSAMPAATVVQMAAQAAAEVGLLTPVDAGRGAIGSLVLGSTTLVPAPAALQAAHPEWQHLLGAWQAFRQAEAELAHELVTSCDKGITARIESD